MAAGERVTFDLQLGALGPSELRVRRFEGTEALSAPFWFAVEFIPISGEPIALDPLVGGEAAVRISRPGGAERWVHGICRRAELLRVEAGGKPAYQAVLAPRLTRLDGARDCRVFQGKSAVDIVKAVLDQHGVIHREALSASYPTRELCIQYRETDLAFVSRLLAEEGITYWFEHSSDKDTLVLGDSPSAFTALPGGALPFRQEQGAVADEEHLYALCRALRVAPARATLRDYDFEHPAVDVTAPASLGVGEEHYDYPSGNAVIGENGRLARARLEQLRFDAEGWDGQGTAARLAPGAVFQVEGHLDPAYDVRLVAVRVRHEGRQERSAGGPAAVEDSYRNEFLAAPADRACRPVPQTRRGLVRGPQTATVVGPSGEEIHPDRHGRIRVQFHWDRKGKRDDTASAWIRLAQPWAGAGMGAVAVPRLGQEVLVRFLEGNPDRPVVSGAVYNGSNPPPIALPDERTKSTNRSDSSPGGEGKNNELRFEDQAGAEEVFLHGQKDESVEIRNDKAQSVRGSEQLRVEKDRSRTVKGEQQLFVAVDEASEIGGDQTLLVQGHRTTVVSRDLKEAVGQSQTLQVQGTRDVRIAGAAAETVGAAAALTIGGGYSIGVALASNEAVGLVKSVEVGGAAIEVVGAMRDEQIHGDRTSRAGGEWNADVKGALSLQTAQDLDEDVAGATDVETPAPALLQARAQTFEADQFTLVVGGKKAITIEKSGSILISGTTVTVNGTTVALKGASVAKLGPASAAAQTVKAKKAKELRIAPATAAFSLVDLDGLPLVNQAFEVKGPDGAIRKGRTTADGQGAVPLGKSGQFQLTVSKDGGSPSDKDAKRGKAARRGAQRIERGKPSSLATGKEHVLELAERVGMTVAFLFEPGRDKEHPKFVLESDDGAYRQELSPKDDLVQGDRLLQLRFTGLLGGRAYRLTRSNGPGQAEIIFDGRRYEQIIDQPRPEIEDRLNDGRVLRQERKTTARD